MTEPQSQKLDRENLLEEAFYEYSRRVDAGENIDREAFVLQYPEFANVLAAQLNADSIVRRMAGPTFAEFTKHGGDDQTSVADFRTDQTDSGHSRHPVIENDTVVTSHPDDTHPSVNLIRPEIPTSFGRYQVEKLIGQGAMGSVYVAQDTKLERRVALKIPKFDLVAEVEMLERFYREARAVATLHHPNICPVYDVGELGGHTFLSMAYIEGRPLSDYTKSRRKQGERSVAKLVMKLARALQEAHEIGVVHRDLKPANIMVGKKGEPVVMDFGLARCIDSNETRVTKLGTIVGTPAYMSPEQVEGEPDTVGPASDQYSLGVILYEMLTGELPFQGTILSVIGKIAHTEPRCIEELRPDVDPQLIAICQRMMYKNPADRFTNMASVADALNQYLTQSKMDGSPEVSQWSVVSADKPVLPKPRRQNATATTVTVKQRRARRKQRRNRIYSWPYSTIASILSLITIVVAVMLYVRTPEGTVQIEITDSSIHVEFANQTFTTHDNGQKIEVTPGKHALSVKRGSLFFTTEEFTVEKNGNVAITVSWQDGELLAKRGENVIGSKPGAVVNSEGQNETNATVPNPDEISLIHRFEGHRKAGVGAMAIDVSADGRWMISAGGDEGLARLWDVQSKRFVMTLVGPRSSHNRVAMSPNGKHAAFLGHHGPMAIWDLSTGKVLHETTLDSRGAALAFSPNGSRLLTVTEHGVATLWDVESGQSTRQHNFGQWTNECLFLDDDRAIIAMGDPWLWDIEHNKVEKLFDTAGCDCVAASPNGERLAIGRGDHDVEVWDIDTKKLLYRFSGHKGRLASIRFLPNQRYLISGGVDGRIIIWDCQTGREELRKENLGHLANTIVPLPDGRQIASFGCWYPKDVPNPVEGDYAVRLWQLPESIWPQSNPSPTEAGRVNK